MRVRGLAPTGFWRRSSARFATFPDEPLVAGFDASGGGGAWNVISVRRSLDARDVPAPIRIPGEQSRDRNALLASAMASSTASIQLACPLSRRLFETAATQTPRISFLKLPPNVIGKLHLATPATSPEWPTHKRLVAHGAYARSPVDDDAKHVCEFHRSVEVSVEHYASRPAMESGLTNRLGFTSYLARVKAAYGVNYERLNAIKNKYDPKRTKLTSDRIFESVNCHQN